MKLKKLLLMATIIIMAIFLFTGCGTPKVPDIDQMAEDLAATNSTNFNISYQYDSSVKTEFLDVSSVELIKRKTDEDAGIDTAYIVAMLDNEYYTASVNYTLTYNLYDEGGWILDEYEVTDYSIDAKSNPLPVEEINFTRFALRGVFHETDFINNESGTTEDGHFYNTLSFEGINGYLGMSLYTTGTYSFIFENGVWFEEYHIDSVQYDLNPMLGTWIWTGTNYDDYLSITIEDLHIIDDENAEIVYNYNSSTNNTPGHITSKRSESSLTQTIPYSTEDIKIFEDIWTVPSSFYLDVVLGQPVSPLFQDGIMYYNEVRVSLSTEMGPQIFTREGKFIKAY